MEEACANGMEAVDVGPDFEPSEEDEGEETVFPSEEESDDDIDMATVPSISWTVLAMACLTLAM